MIFGLFKCLIHRNRLFWADFLDIAMQRITKKMISRAQIKEDDRNRQRLMKKNKTKTSIKH